MMIQVTCSCGKELRARAEHAGKRAKCPRCGQVLLIPKPAPAAPSTDDEAFQLFIGETSSPEPAVPAPPAAESPSPVPAAAGRYGFQDEPPPVPPVPRPRKTTPPPAAPPPLPVPTPSAAGGAVRHYGYWLLLLALVPLGFSLFQSDNDTRERFERSIERIPPEKIQALEKK